MILNMYVYHYQVYTSSGVSVTNSVTDQCSLLHVEISSVINKYPLLL